MAEASRQQVLTSVKNLLTSGDYSDLIITCGSDTYNVHKSIVCTRADFFARAVRFGGKEATEGKVDLPEDEPAIIKLLVQYLYDGEYEPRLPEPRLPEKPITEIPAGNTPRTKFQMHGKKAMRTNVPKTVSPHTCCNWDDADGQRYCDYSNPCEHHYCGQQCDYNCQKFVCDQCNPPALPAPASPGTAAQLLTHAKMFAIADKYDVVGLQQLVQEKFKRACATLWNEDTFPVAAHHAFSTAPADNGLRDIVSATISDHKELMQRPEVQAIMTEFNGLALGILLKVVNGKNT